MNAEPPLSQRVFQRLDDRHFRSGEALAADLAVTRAAVWKAVEQLRARGVASAMGLRGGLTAWRAENLPVVSGRKARGK